MSYPEQIAQQLSLGIKQVEQTVALLEGGATIPFIARYRKEATGGLNEVQVAAIRDALVRLKALDARRDAVLEALAKQGVLTPELEQALRGADSLSAIEDIYLPFKPKRRTRAMVARERGLEPLAKALMEQRGNPAQMAAPFVDPSKSVPTVDDALAGARDIIAEQVAENGEARQRQRLLLRRTAVLSSQVVKGKEAEAAKFKSWFDWHEPAAKAPSHRLLAIMRGDGEKLLRMKLAPGNEEEALQLLCKQFLKAKPTAGSAAEQVLMAIRDGYSRLMAPSMETELRNALKQRADKEAIRVFADNLRQLLLAPPLGQKRVLAIDPGFRTGCKVVCLDSQGTLLHNETIHPFASVREERAAVSKLEALVDAFKIEAIAIGNGTASRETEEVVQKCRFKRKVIAVMVDESGASVYSASEVARREFPEYDITVRGAVSIGRRLMDPLSELVKIDPKSIGVGQYQHDVDQPMLQQGLDDVVLSCVNQVGVELNTASAELLSYVSGIGPALAANIVAYRDSEGPFPSREGLKQVPRLGAKAFEQCAGFLRVRESTNPLDRTAVHPESYAIVQLMAETVGTTVEQLMADKALRDKLNLQQLLADLQSRGIAAGNAEVGMPTLTDIMRELDKPGLDPRAKFEVFEFDKNVTRIEDVREGMVLPGIVTNITAFGAFVNIGVHQDGLVHISQMADRRVADPSQVVHLHQHVKVRVLEVDLPRHRISLSMKALPE
ncbi:MAG: RNA-binding transcriptional accessory protein [Bacteroidales bacterium]|nr:RNA-binding transcriptional accessory protein [Bacteroidales bacterium]